MLVKEIAVRDYQEQFAPYLEGNEAILWAGKPRQGLTLRPYDLYAIPFVLLWLGMVTRLTYSFEGAFGLLIIPFYLVGFYFLIGRFFWEAYERRQTFYAVTERRVLILSKPLWHHLRELMLNELPEIALYQERDERGTILFGPPLPIESYQIGAFNNRVSPRFESITAARDVYTLTRHAQERVFEERSDA